MKALILSLVATGALLLPLGGGALAASSNHTVVGTPGDKNCAGQTNAALAQSAQNHNFPFGPGLGNLASASDVSLQDIKTLVDIYCED